MYISYEGIGYRAVTFPLGDCVEGQVCKVNLLGMVDKCSAGDKFCGVCEAIDKRMVAVQLEGFVKVSYSGNTPAVGYSYLAADGNGGVMLDTDGREYLVVATDIDTMTAIIKL